MSLRAEVADHSLRSRLMKTFRELNYFRYTMPKAALFIIVHQVVFQAMFVVKNIYLKHKTGKSIRGKNNEVNYSILFFFFFIACAISLSFYQSPMGSTRLIDVHTAEILGLLLILMNLSVSAAALLNMEDSWRIGILENDNTRLIVNGIYRLTRNPYFLFYLLMFAAYTVLPQNSILLGLSVVGFMLIHSMIKSEEKYLLRVHGADYLQYKKQVPRYFIL
jgi:protein-S-isoprenylcysteine O-methyltransferase Ste14